MVDRIEDVEGIGNTYGARLKAAGIANTDQFLNRAKSRKDREGLAAELGIDAPRILKWANHCDLFRIKGIAGQMAELLEAAGVDSVKELARRVPGNLAQAMADANAKRKLCEKPPSAAVVTKWIDEAKALPPILTY